eukprot:gene26053-11753_t
MASELRAQLLKWLRPVVVLRQAAAIIKAALTVSRTHLSSSLAFSRPSTIYHHINMQHLRLLPGSFQSWQSGSQPHACARVTSRRRVHQPMQAVTPPMPCSSSLQAVRQGSSSLQAVRHGSSSFCVNRQGCNSLHTIRQGRSKSTSPSPTASSASSLDSPPTIQKGADLGARLMNYKMEVELEDGVLIISALRVPWLQATADILTEAFTEAKNIKAYKRLLRRQISSYLQDHIQMPPAALVITAVLKRNDRPPSASSTDSTLDGLLGSEAAASGDDGDALGFGPTSDEGGRNDRDKAVWVPPASLADELRLPMEKDEILLGVAEVSLSVDTRSSNLTLNPPEKCSYLCNM